MSDTKMHPVMALFEQVERKSAELNRIRDLAELLLQRIEATLQQNESLTAEEISDLAQALSHYWEIKQSLDAIPGAWKNDK